MKERTLKIFESFVLGVCRCYCETQIPIRNKKGLLARFKKSHNKNAFQKGKNNPNYKRGWFIDHRGYTHVLKPEHPFANKKGYVKKHRLIYENYLSILFDEEVYIPKPFEVHHIKPVLEGGTNEIKNLILFENHSKHLSYEQTLDKTGRYCLVCGEKTRTDKKTGREYWFIHKDGFMCVKCYYKEYHKRKKKIVKLPITRTNLWK